MSAADAPAEKPAVLIIGGLGTTPFTVDMGEQC
jgi:hypothetical protein